MASTPTTSSLMVLVATPSLPTPSLMPLMTCQERRQCLHALPPRRPSHCIHGPERPELQRWRRHDETDAQTTYSVDGLPEAAIGTVFLADGETAITAGEESHSSSCKVCNSSQHQMLLDKLNSPSRSLMASAPSPKPLRSTSSTSTTHRCYQPMPSP